MADALPVTEGGSSVAFGTTLNGTYGINTAIPKGFTRYPDLRAVIAGGATSVSVDLGGHGQIGTPLFLTASDAAGRLIGSVSELHPPSGVGMTTLTIRGANIAFVTFGSRGPSGGSNPLGGSVFADNFRYEPASVLEPASIAMAGTSVLVGLGVAWRRRKQVA